MSGQTLSQNPAVRSSQLLHFCHTTPPPDMRTTSCLFLTLFPKIVAPSMFDAYGGSAFPGVGDILYNINEQVKIAFNKGKCQRMLLNHSTAQDTGSAEHTRLVKVL